MKKKLTFIAFINIFISSLFGNGFEISNFQLDNLVLDRNIKGVDLIRLGDSEYKADHTTDILLHFNSSDFIDSAGNYRVKDHYNNITSKEKILGSSSAYFFKEKGITYVAESNSMFTKGRILGDFTIEFWINPTAISNDTTIFLWKGVNKVDSEFIPQKISCSFSNRALKWSFDNFFIPEDLSELNLSLVGKSKLIPDSWSHHLIRYSSETGIIEYLMNGIPEDIIYSTPSTKENHNILTPYIGNFSKSEIYIAPRFSGFLDELRISEDFIDEPNLNRFQSYGNFKTPVIKLDKLEVLINKLHINDMVTPETLITYYYRVSPKPFIPGAKEEWVKYNRGDLNIHGKYIQFKGELYSNGNRQETPEVYSLNLDWKPIPTPPPPQFVNISKGRESITLSWEHHKHLNISGYKIYIGTKSNNYEEMIDIGNNSTYTIYNLESNSIYYLSVRSYNSRGIEGEYSREFFTRPD